jgi:hypothetical protein
MTKAFYPVMLAKASILQAERMDVHYIQRDPGLRQDDESGLKIKFQEFTERL